MKPRRNAPRSIPPPAPQRTAIYPHIHRCVMAKSTQSGETQNITLATTHPTVFHAVGLFYTQHQPIPPHF
ncbi:MAG TPA: hypothetical protein IGS31_13225 [Oscillatoriales cyanobacterium M4454_W2019_049]|nr:hypothetical protein [Oscillatoriales cyanobacterium M4454_W2019_049]